MKIKNQPAAMEGKINGPVIFVMVFGGYALAGGKMGIILKSLPFEMIMIAGAATGTFLLSNDMKSVRHTLKDIAKVFKGPKWMPEDYRNLLCLLFELFRLSRSARMQSRARQSPRRKPLPMEVRGSCRLQSGSDHRQV